VIAVKIPIAEEKP